MEVRSHSNEHLPEVAHSETIQSSPQVVHTQHPYEDFEYYEPQPPAPAPEYRAYSASLPPSSPPLSSPRSPPISLQHSPYLKSERPLSPPLGDVLEPHKDRPFSASPTPRYSEHGEGGLHSVDEKEGEKEVFQSVYPVAIPARKPVPERRPEEKKKKRICGLLMKWFLILAALLLCTIIALAVGLGVGLATKHSHSKTAPPSTSSAPPPSPTHTSAPTPTPTGDPDYNIGGVLDPLYYSTTGAFNGSGIAIASVNFGVDASIFVYFQHYTGEIRSFILEADGTWTDSNVIANNARNGTPLSAVAYLVDEVATWHIFYINNDSYVQQRTSTNGSAFQTNIWTDGPLNDLNLKANDADMIGLQACYWGNFYGDTDYTYSDGFNASSQNVSIAPTGMHLWYADTDTSFQQYSWFNGRDQWDNDNQTWSNMNGHAGVGCQTWLSGTVSYVFMVDLANTVEIWWKDSNSSNETPSHPTNKWVNSTAAIPDVHPSSSLGYTNYLACQFGDETVRGYNISWAAENTTIFPAKDGGTGYDEWTIPAAFGVPGTHMSITALPDQSGGAHLAVLFQTDGNDVTMFSRDDSGGVWTSSSAPVNQ